MLGIGHESWVAGYMDWYYQSGPDVDNFFYYSPDQDQVQPQDADHSQDQNQSQDQGLLLGVVQNRTDYCNTSLVYYNSRLLQ